MAKARSRGTKWARLLERIPDVEPGRVASVCRDCQQAAIRDRLSRRGRRTATTVVSGIIIVGQARQQLRATTESEWPAAGLGGHEDHATTRSFPIRSRSRTAQYLDTRNVLDGDIIEAGRSNRAKEWECIGLLGGDAHTIHEQERRSRLDEADRAPEHNE